VHDLLPINNWACTSCKVVEYGSLIGQSTADCVHSSMSATCF